jgi:hypothetical protein
MARRAATRTRDPRLRRQILPFFDSFLYATPSSPFTCQRAEHHINVACDLLSDIGSGRAALMAEIVCELLDAF